MSCSCTPLASDFFWKTPTSCKSAMLCYQFMRSCELYIVICKQKQDKQLLLIQMESQPEPCAGVQSKGHGHNKASLSIAKDVACG